MQISEVVSSFRTRKTASESIYLLSFYCDTWLDLEEAEKEGGTVFKFLLPASYLESIQTLVRRRMRFPRGRRQELDLSGLLVVSAVTCFQEPMIQFTSRKYSLQVTDLEQLNKVLDMEFM